MPRATLVPITPSVLSWAIEESGYPRSEISGRLKIDSATLASWERGESNPTLTEFRSLAHLLRRQTAVFFLPEPPQGESPVVELRGPPGQMRANFTPDERKYIRQVARIQRAVAWIARESGDVAGARLPTMSQRDDAEDSASKVRDALGMSVATQLAWKDSSAAFQGWREALERFGLSIFVLPLGSKSARGMSLWNADAPAAIVNSAWNVEARIFTLFHEVGHVVTRTNSACIGYVAINDTDARRRIERWCDRFAAAFLMPSDSVKNLLRQECQWKGQAVADLELPARLSRRLKVSLRASVLRLIELKIAERSLYGQIPATSDDKSGSGGGKGRTRAEARDGQFGNHVKKALARAVREDLMTRADALSYLDIGDDDFAATVAA